MPRVQSYENHLKFYLVVFYSCSSEGTGGKTWKYREFRVIDPFKFHCVYVKFRLLTSTSSSTFRTVYYAFSSSLKLWYDFFLIIFRILLSALNVLLSIMCDDDNNDDYLLQEDWHLRDVADSVCVFSDVLSDSSLGISSPVSKLTLSWQPARQSRLTQNYYL